MILDNNGTIEISATLTRLGKQRINENEFTPTKFALSDDNINYSLIDNTLIIPDIKVQRTPFFNVYRDGASLLKNKLRVMTDGENELLPALHNFQFSFGSANRQSNQISVDGKTRQNPSITIDETGVKTIVYYITNSEIAKKPIDSVINIDYASLPMKKNQYITATLHSQQYFDLKLTDENVKKNTKFSTNNNTFNRNFNEATIYTNKRVDLPKIVNTYCTDISQDILNAGQGNASVGITQLQKMFGDSYNVGFSNGISLRYKGNFVYQNVGIASYDTLLTLFSEETGQYENIKIIIKLI